MARSIDKYTRTIAASSKTISAFRWDFYSQILLTPVELLIVYSLWGIVFESAGGGAIGGLSFKSTITYLFLARLASKIIGSSSFASLHVGDEIQGGGLVVFLTRPINYALYSLSRIAPLALIAGILMLPFLVVLAVSGGLLLPSGILAYVFFVVFLFLSFLLSFVINLLFGFSAFFLRQTRSVWMTYDTVVDFISGGFIPLTMYPLWTQKIFEWLPFRFIYHVPLTAFLGQLSLQEGLSLVSVELFWIALIAALAYLIWRRGLLVFDAQGG